MNPLLLASLLAVAPVGPSSSASPVSPDTTVTLRRGDRVVVERFGGDVRVVTWSRAALAVEGDGDELRWAGVTRSGEVVTVRPNDRKARRIDVDMVIRVPAWVDLQVEGRELEVSVSGLEGDVDIRNVSGDITVEGGARRVNLSTMEGKIVVRGARGPVRAHSRGDDVSLSDVRGDVDVASGDGDLHLEDVDVPSLKAETLDGDVFFSGTLAPGGPYAISVHDGDATLVLPRDTDADVSVSTFDGEFSSEFPVTLHGYGGGGKFDFTLGRGGARLDVSVFDGEIRLRRRDGR